MTTENRIRKLLASKLTLVVTRKKRGPFIVIDPDGMLTDHKTKKGALNYLLEKIRCTNSLNWTVRARPK